MKQHTAVEFFSGMGSFAEACRDFPITIVGCFDQSQLANLVYKHNFGMAPCHSNLDSLDMLRIPEADIWWMSPPCAPYSVRGNRADDQDPRAKSFLHLISMIPHKLPSFIVIENVQGFKQTQAERKLLEGLAAAKYYSQELDLCSTDFGVPMRRPRHFVVAARQPLPQFSAPARSPGRPGDCLQGLVPQHDVVSISAISSFIKSAYNNDTIVSEADAANLRQSTNIIRGDDSNAIAICFTKNYYRCRLSSGSLIELSDGRLRRFASGEMLGLFGFSSQYTFPDDVTEEQATRLLGNAVDIRVIRYLLQVALQVTPSQTG